MTLFNRTAVHPRVLFAGRIQLIAAGMGLISLAQLAAPLYGQISHNSWGDTKTYLIGTNVGLGTNDPYWLLSLLNGSLGIIGGVAIVQVGSAASPSYEFNGSSNGYSTGMFSPAGGIGFSVSGTERLRIDTNGAVGIGTMNPGQCGNATQTCKLTVNGAIGAKEIVVLSGITADYVFKSDYRLPPLSEVAEYVRKNHHLPEIPSETEVEQNGISVGDMQVKLLAKIEELTLHMIQANERNNRLEKENRELQERVARLETPVATTDRH